MKNLKQIAYELTERLDIASPYESEDNRWKYYNHVTGWLNGGLVLVKFKHHQNDIKGEIVVESGCGAIDEVIKLLKDIEHNQVLTVERVVTTVKIEKI